MKLRTRLVLAFLYILIVVIVALAVPLGATLARRAKADLEAETLQNAQTIAAYIGPSEMADTVALDALLDEAVPPEIARTIVVDAAGVVIYDSIDTAVGEDFAGPQRPEIRSALRGDPYAEDRFSQTENAEIMVAAAPIIDGQVIGALRLTRDYAEVDGTSSYPHTTPNPEEE